MITIIIAPLSVERYQKFIVFKFKIYCIQVQEVYISTYIVNIFPERFKSLAIKTIMIAIMITITITIATKITITIIIIAIITSIVVIIIVK